ncbi:MAG: lamin tail domain-containing protein, partial [Chitinophagales bacterium]
MGKKSQGLNFKKGGLSQWLLVIFCIWVFPMLVNAQIDCALIAPDDYLFCADFGETNLTDAPNFWTGAVNDFELLDGQLHAIANTDNNSATISSNVANGTLVQAVWEMDVIMNFNPSSSNYTDVFLFSSQADLSSTAGYFVRIGSSQDEISLYRKDGTSNVKIIDGADDVVDVSSVEVRIRVVRNTLGEWSLEHDVDLTGNFVNEGSVEDTTHETFNHFGVSIRYTSTRADQFYFDNVLISGEIFTDTTPPTVVGTNVLDATTVQIQFSEGLDPITVENVTNYDLGLPLTNAQLSENDASLVVLTLLEPFTPDINYALSIQNLADLLGNLMETTVVNFTYEASESFEVLINEIYADPNPPEDVVNNVPSLNLPPVKYVELYNNSNKTVELFNWEFRDDRDTVFFNETFALLPDSYVVLCKKGEEEAFLDAGISVLPVSGFPTLNVSGDKLQLFNPDGVLIHAVAYKKSWYNDPIREEGGWSLELIDPSNPCEGQTNWQASEASIGGTPGSVNSVSGNNADVIQPQLLRAEVVNPTILVLYFSEILHPNSVNDLEQIIIDQGIGHPQNAELIAPDFTSMFIELSEPLQTGTVYTVSLAAIRDCSGNAIGTENTAFVGIPQNAETGDIIINEVLFNPVSGGVDFVELYNASDKIINLAPFYLFNADLEVTPGILMNPSSITTERYSFYPNEYVVLTENWANVLATYGGDDCQDLTSSRFIETDLPTYDDREGVVAIADLFQGLVLDRLDYTDDWHYALIDGLGSSKFDGVSLERISPQSPSQDADNWHSAAATVCYATPGQENSQSFVSNENQETSFSLQPSTFSPDGDSFDDFLILQYELAEAGYTANITIFDDRGRTVQQLVRNELLANTGSFKWDGLIDGTKKASIGIYIVYIELFNLQGEV